MNEEKNNLKMRLIASFYLVVFIGALISMGLVNSRHQAEVSNKQSVAQLITGDSIPLAGNAGATTEAVPSGITSKDEGKEDKSPIDFSLDIPSLLQRVFGFSLKRLSTSSITVPTVNFGQIWLKWCNIRI
ncbi:MAG: hypothetical protein MH137_13760 [Flavobacteriales bacterium]|nr:hypothetical protein [Flavobacteriales bacterium]